MFGTGEKNYFDRVEQLEPRLGDALEAIINLQERMRILEERMAWLIEQLERAQERD